MIIYCVPELETNLAYAFSINGPQNSGGDPNQGQKVKRPFKVGSMSSTTYSLHLPKRHNRKRKNPDATSYKTPLFIHCFVSRVCGFEIFVSIYHYASVVL